VADNQPPTPFIISQIPLNLPINYPYMSIKTTILQPIIKLDPENLNYYNIIKTNGELYTSSTGNTRFDYNTAKEIKELLINNTHEAVSNHMEFISLIKPHL
jgi:hypothetical protein